MGKVYRPPFNYLFEVPEYIGSQRIYLYVYRLVKEEAFYIGRLELNNRTNTWKFGISISAKQLIKPEQIANLEAWANQHIPRRLNKLLEKVNENQ